MYSRPPGVLIHVWYMCDKGILHCVASADSPLTSERSERPSVSPRGYLISLSLQHVNQTKELHKGVATACDGDLDLPIDGRVTRFWRYGCSDFRVVAESEAPARARTRSGRRYPGTDSETLVQYSNSTESLGLQAVATSQLCRRIQTRHKDPSRVQFNVVFVVSAYALLYKKRVVRRRYVGVARPAPPKFQ